MMHPQVVLPSPLTTLHRTKNIPSKRKKKKKTSFPATGFTAITNEMIDSEAFMALGNSARVALLLLMRQKRNPHQFDVKFPYSDARKYMNASTFARAIDELVKMGFVELEIAKRLGHDIRQPNVYGFSQKWKTDAVNMADSIRCPKIRRMRNPKTGLFQS